MLAKTVGSGLLRAVLKNKMLYQQGTVMLYATQSPPGGAKPPKPAAKPKKKSAPSPAPAASQTVAAAPTPPPPPPTFDITSYKVPEYYSHNDFSFYDIENEMSSSRLTQPSSRQSQ